MATAEDWRPVLIAAQKGLEGAKDRRQQMFRLANEAGLSLRYIAVITGVPITTVSRIIGPTGRKPRPVSPPPADL